MPAELKAEQRHVTVIRRAQFAAAHYLALPELSDEENLRRFGLSSNAFAHGHNYELEVSVRGPVEPDTGMVVNLNDLKKLIHDQVILPLDFKNLNQQVPFFKNRLTTLENLAQFIWAELNPALNAISLHLEALRVLESADLFVDYRGGKPLFDNSEITRGSLAMPSQTNSEAAQENWAYLSRTYTFPAGHRLYNPEWSDEENARVFRKCNNINGHGHNYELEVTLGGTPDPRLGMVADLYALDQMVQRVILDRVDHQNLNLDVDFLHGLIPTAENIVRAMWNELLPHIPAPAQLTRLRLRETANNVAEYRG